MSTNTEQTQEDVIDDLNFYAMAIIELVEKVNEVSKRHGEGFIPGRNELTENRWITIGGPRQTGKSAAIAELATPSDLLLCKNEEQIKNVINKSLNKGLDGFMLSSAVINGNVDLAYGEMFDKIWVDDASVVFADPAVKTAFIDWVMVNYEDKLPIVICVG